jgi:membrane associated rhomboid family serine protease
MGAGSIFLMRMGLGIVFAYVVVKVFFPEGSILMVGAFAGFFVGLAYMLAYFRTKRQEQERLP